MISSLTLGSPGSPARWATAGVAAKIAASEAAARIGASAATATGAFMRSDPFRQQDGETTTGTDEARQEGVGKGGFGAFVDGGLAMLELFLAKGLDRSGEVRLLAAERAQLVGIMAVDLGFDGGGAGHC